MLIVNSVGIMILFIFARLCATCLLLCNYVCCYYDVVGLVMCVYFVVTGGWLGFLIGFGLLLALLAIVFVFSYCCLLFRVSVFRFGLHGFRC